MEQKKQKPGALVDSYTKFEDNHAHYVDKTLFIAQVLVNTSRVQRYTSPRRFGKTMTFTTLHSFIA